MPQDDQTPEGARQEEEDAQDDRLLDDLDPEGDETEDVQGGSMDGKGNDPYPTAPR